MINKAVLIIHGFAGSPYDQEEFANYLRFETKYDVLIDKYNMNRLRNGFFIKGKLKTHGKSKDFKQREKGEIYYTNRSVWLYQHHY